jgi:hypothetical protein
VVFWLGVGQSEDSAMTHKVTTLKLVVPTVLALTLGISLGAVHLTDKHLFAADQTEANNSVAGSEGITELPTPDGRLWRVHLLLSGMK